MSAVLDHISIGVSDIAKGKAFYDAVMPALGFSLQWENPRMVAYGVKGGDDFGIQLDDGAPRHGTHVAFRASDRATVDRFHAAAMAAGGIDDGAPGLRTAYHPNYYGAFVRDPDGNRIEAVCHEAEG